MARWDSSHSPVLPRTETCISKAHREERQRTRACLQQCHRVLASSTAESTVPCSRAREEAAIERPAIREALQLPVVDFLQEAFDAFWPEGCLLPERLPSEGGRSCSPSPSQSKSAAAALGLCCLPARRMSHLPSSVFFLQQARESAGAVVTVISTNKHRNHHAPRQKVDQYRGP